MRIKRNCLICNKEFLWRPSPSRVKKNWGIFCSKICKYKYSYTAWNKGLKGDFRVIKAATSARLHLKPRSRECIFCKNNFYSLSPSKIICEKCSWFKCLACQKVFFRPSIRGTKYCSKICRYEDFGIKMRDRYPERLLLSKLTRVIRKTRMYEKWRQGIFKRDKICIFCKSSHALNIDHFPFALVEIINKFKLKSIKQAYSCKILWDINNGRVLCRNCHKMTPTYGNNQYDILSI